jgi:hypothetical protein
MKSGVEIAKLKVGYPWFWWRRLHLRFASGTEEVEERSPALLMQMLGSRRAVAIWIATHQPPDNFPLSAHHAPQYRQLITVMSG